MTVGSNSVARLLLKVGLIIDQIAQQGLHAGQ